MAADVPLFNKEKHVSYWLRCLRSPLPTAYTSMDSNRMMLSFFTLSALDLLGVLFTRTEQEERRGYADWIYRCQHPKGGFRGFPGTDFGERASDANAVWDPANLAATFFALSGLCVLGDDLQKVDRHACLEWLSVMQRQDGAFGELKTTGGDIVGGGDSRFAYMAAGIRWILKGDKNDHVDGIAGINVKRLLAWISSVKTRDGGYSTDVYHEAHAGLTFCAIAAKRLLGNDMKSDVTTSGRPESFNAISSASQETTVFEPESTLTVQFLVSRLTTQIDEDDVESTEGMSSNSLASKKSADEKRSLPSAAEPYTKATSQSSGNRIAGRLGLDAEYFFAECTKPVCWTGFCGRCNKVADTCYNFWAGASLEMLCSLDIIDIEHTRRYLLEKTQHSIMGGFGKFPGDLPDIYHAYLGLAALSLINGQKTDGPYIGPDIEDASKIVEGQPSKTKATTRDGDTDRTIRALDPVLCISTSARRWVEALEWRHHD